jgi:hypothetical protein
VLFLSLYLQLDTGLATDPTNERAPPPFTYDRSQDLKHQKVIFNQVGQYATDVTFLHAEIRVPFKHIQKHITEAMQMMLALLEHVKGTKFEESTASALSYMQVPILFAQRRYNEVLRKLPEHDVTGTLTHEPGRFRRLDPITAAVTAGTSILGWVFEFFKAKEIQNIREDLRYVEDRVHKIVDDQRILFATSVRHQETLNNHTELLRINHQRWAELFTVDQAAALTKVQQVSSMCEEEVRILSNTIALAQLGKINPDQISVEALKDIVDFVQLATNARGMVSPVHVASDIFAMPMSYVYNEKEKIFYFIVHIPFVRAEQVMDMFEYVPFPMTMSNSEDHVALPRPGHHNVLAINTLQEYQTLNSGDLQHCLKLARVHYCQGRQILRTNFRKSCLGALYVRDSEAATRYCDFQIQPADERVFKMKADEYLVYTNKELVATRICGAESEQMQITEGTRIKVPTGCRVRLVDHQIYGEDSFKYSHQETQIFDWTWDAQRLIRNVSGEAFKTALQELEHEAGMLSFETEDILQQIHLDNDRREARDYFGWAKWITPLISGFMSCVVSIAIIGFLRLYLIYRSRAQSPQTLPVHLQLGGSYPSAPPAELAHQQPPPRVTFSLPH